MVDSWWFQASSSCQQFATRFGRLIQTDFHVVHGLKSTSWAVSARYFEGIWDDGDRGNRNNKFPLNTKKNPVGSILFTRKFWNSRWRLNDLAMFGSCVFPFSYSRKWWRRPLLAPWKPWVPCLKPCAICAADTALPDGNSLGIAEWMGYNTKSWPNDLDDLGVPQV